MTKADLYRFMVQHRLGVLSSVSSGGSPQSALVGIAVTAQLEILFDTLKTTRKYPNLIAHPACSFVIGWEGEQTLQFEGIAQELEKDAERTHYQQVYFEAWPECTAHLSWPGIVYFVVKPRWVRFSDYDAKPPVIQEFTESDLP